MNALLVWIIIGYGWNLHCTQTGCTSADIYWTGTEKHYSQYLPQDWSNNWKDAKQYTPSDLDPNFDIPNGRHCCYSEYPTPIDPQTGKVTWPDR